MTGKGPMMDKEEMMEALMNQGGQSMTPYPFEKIADNLRAFKFS
jgi:hypothetical protein